MLDADALVPTRSAGGNLRQAQSGVPSPPPPLPVPIRRSMATSLIPSTVTDSHQHCAA
ncbi:hypothetical protein FRACA_550002 [Frankia canadensis]|uniref:Uncharacterized protein n=1 Tax=Frankia canadensis TaxID=1836972 RepID=A0A2I2KYW6_9ACTN|nr:hypothetical protein FRACA_550002 [Frankia canadensis]SOU58137.1 hypothetical protein FRACA_550002 [Frankia canadensis]